MKTKAIVAHPALLAGAVLMSITVAEAMPIAVLDATPNPTVPGLPVLFDMTGSSESVPGRNLVLYELDFEGDGTFDFSSASATTVSHTYATTGIFNSLLRVTNDAPNAEDDIATLTVSVIIPPHPPIADANGPYIFEIGSGPFFLDGSGSFDIDEGLGEIGAPGDTITEYAWELGDALPVDFDDAFGIQPDVTAFYTALGPGTYNAGLRVTDNTSVAFPSTGRPDLIDRDFTTVIVQPAQGTAPEPAVLALLGIGLAGIGYQRRKQIKAA